MSKSSERRTRRKFTDQFKADAVALVEESGGQIAKVAKVARIAKVAVGRAVANGRSYAITPRMISASSTPVSFRSRPAWR